MSIAVAALAATFFATVSPAAGYAGFGDVEEEGFYAPGVQWMTNLDITQGKTETCFAPYEAVNRAQAGTFLWRMEGSQSAPRAGFADVPDGAFFTDAVDWMVDQDITQGFDAQTFGPDRPLTRGQFATFLWRLEGQPNAPAGGFADVPAGAFFEDAVDWMVDQGITYGYGPETFGPERTVTRGEVATFLWRYKGEQPVALNDSSPICGADPSERDELDTAFDLTGWEWLGDERGEEGSSFTGTALTFPAPFGELAARRDTVASQFRIETVLDFSPTASKERAGLIVTDGDDYTNYVNLVRSFDQGLVFNSRVGGTFQRVQPAAVTADTVHLRLSFEDGAFSGQYSTDGVTWTDLGYHVRTMTNPMVGVYNGGWEGVGTPPPASFQYFDQTALCDPDVC